MKTAEEILDDRMSCQLEDGADLNINSDAYYPHYDVIKAIEQAQKEAYNDALEDATNFKKVKTYYDENIGWCVEKDSILKLKI